MDYYIVTRYIRDLKQKRIDLINIQLQHVVFTKRQKTLNKAIKSGAKPNVTREMKRKLDEASIEMRELLRRFHGHHLENFAKALALGKQRK